MAYQLPTVSRAGTFAIENVDQQQSPMPEQIKQ